jgi:hypothetical protein
MKTWQNRFLIAFLALAGIASVLWAITHYSGVAIHPNLQAAVRWGAIAALCAYSFVRRSLTPWIFAGMLLGAELGHELGKQAANLQVLSGIFLKLVKTIVAPLIFSTLVVGIASHSNLKQVGRMGIKALLYFELVTTVALFIGLGAINLTQAGVGVPQPSAAASATVAATPQKWTDIVLHIFPENIAKSVAEGQILQIVVFSVIFGIALAQIGEEKRRPMLAFCESLSELMFKFTNIVMLFAPIGVAGAMAYTVGTMGFGVMGNLVKLLLSGALFAPWLNRFPLPLPPPVLKRPCHARWKTWKPLACPSRSWLLFCPPGTASTWTAAHCICRSLQSLWPKRLAFILASASNSLWSSPSWLPAKEWLAFRAPCWSSCWERLTLSTCRFGRCW